jgi:hypothetical protein
LLSYAQLTLTSNFLFEICPKKNSGWFHGHFKKG